MHASQNEPARKIGLESVRWAQGPQSSEQRVFIPKSESELLAVRREGNASPSEQTPNCNGFETEVTARDLKSNEQQKLTPKSESQLLAADEFAHVGSPDVPVDRTDYATEPDVSAVPAFGAAFHTFRSSFNGPSVAISMALALIFGIGVGAAWTWKSPHSSSAAAPEQVSHGGFANQLNAIAHDLSSLRQDLKELAARQEQLGAAQARLTDAQEQTLLKLGTIEQVKRGSPTRPARAYR